MQKRQSTEVDAKYYNLDDAAHSAAFEKMSFDINRAESIEWARARCDDDKEIRALVFELRRQLRAQIAKDFPGDAVLMSVLADGQDINHFFVLVGSAADGKYGAALGAMGLYFCEQLKANLNPDLHPSLFEAIRPPQ